MNDTTSKYGHLRSLRHRDFVKTGLDETTAFVAYIDGLIAQIRPPTTGA